MIAEKAGTMSEEIWRMTHPNMVDARWHADTAIFWQIRIHNGKLNFYGDCYSWDIFEDQFETTAQSRTLRDDVIYVQAYKFGRYLDIYAAMEAAGTRLISLEEAEELINRVATVSISTVE